MTSWHQLSDSEFMLELLRDGRELTTTQIIASSIAERGCGLTPHSRAADLRKRGHNIQVTRRGNENGRAVYGYKLLNAVPLSAPEVHPSEELHPLSPASGAESERQLALIPNRPHWA